MNHLIKDSHFFTIKISAYVPEGNVEPKTSIILLKQNEKTYKMKETISGAFPIIKIYDSLSMVARMVRKEIGGKTEVQ